MQQQARPVPLPNAIDRDGEQLDVIPALELVDTVAQHRGEADNVLTKGRQAGLLDTVEPILGNDESALPVVAAVDHDEHVARGQPTEGIGSILGLAREPQPQHVHRCADVVDDEISLRADR